MSGSLDTRRIVAFLFSFATFLLVCFLIILVLILGAWLRMDDDGRWDLADETMEWNPKGMYAFDLCVESE